MKNDSNKARIYHLAFDLWNTTAYSLERDPLIDLIDILRFSSSLEIADIQALIQTREFISSRPFAEICDLLEVPYCYKHEGKFRDLIESERKGFKLFQDTLPVLKTAREIGLTVSLVSNLWNFCLPVVQEVFFSQFQFDHVFFSFDIGSIKPSITFFKAIESVGISLSETLVVGDSLHSDILGAINAGSKAIWLKRDGSCSSPVVSEPFYSDRYLGSITNLYQALEVVQKDLIN
ncbi:HAD family hydrolase [Allocoleopsis franciscana]|nr:HAD family hydrolase [Allocoleopsis franciscana]